MAAVHFLWPVELWSVEFCLCCDLPICCCVCVALVSSEPGPSTLIWSSALRTFAGVSHLSPLPTVCWPVHGSPCTQEMEAAMSGASSEKGRARRRAEKKQISEELGLFCQLSPSCAISAAGKHKSTVCEVQICFCTVRSSLGSRQMKVLFRDPRSG